MNAKQLERFLKHRGINVSAFDVITRKLRDALKVSTGGRGLNAHNLTVDEVAWLLATYAGSDVAAQADRTLARLIDLHEPEGSRPAQYRAFILAFQMILQGELLGVHEVRVCRNLPLAAIRFDDGREERYAPRSINGTKVTAEHAHALGQSQFRSEGVLPGALLADLALALAAEQDQHDASVAVVDDADYDE